jgi:hypothetical protein
MATGTVAAFDISLRRSSTHFGAYRSACDMANSCGVDDTSTSDISSARAAPGRARRGVMWWSLSSVRDPEHPTAALFLRPGEKGAMQKTQRGDGWVEDKRLGCCEMSAGRVFESGASPRSTVSRAPKVTP